MSSKQFFATSLVFFLGSQLAFAISPEWAQKENKKISEIVKKSGLGDKNLGVYIAGGEGTPVPVFALEEEKKMIPASITKLVTAAAVISQFPPGYRFKTHLLSSAKIEGNKLKGDLILKGGGDPSFVSENLWFLVNAFLRTGITSIEGNILVDDSLFDRVRYDSSRQKERVDRAYDAPAGAMSFNWNSVNVFVRPGNKAGAPAQVFVDPENDYIRLVGKVETVSGNKTNLSIDRDEDSKAEGDVLIVSGKIAVGAKEQVIYKNITRPDLWSGANLKYFLRQRGVDVKGLVKAGGTPSSAQILAESESKPIEHILADMNKFSNNYVAEMLCKNLSVEEGVGSLSKGMKKLTTYLEKLKVPAKHYELFNPSGLTRDNRMTALSLWQVLNDMKFQFRYQPEFLSSLPIAGVDGTLKRRMKDGPAERSVRAKTGYLTGVISLAGYAGRADGTVLPFVLIYNGSADEGKVRAVFDQIATSLVAD
jgi:D-alanyl-D-alanine carboxypeptidase/D-alanyl-D-alanine-endopeptidase (penicillin-binding protein 4)